jgi:hypothetical protein
VEPTIVEPAKALFAAPDEYMPHPLALFILIALNSAAAVRIGSIFIPVVTPFAPPVWFIIGRTLSVWYMAVPLVGANVSVISTCELVPDIAVLDPCPLKNV